MKVCPPALGELLLCPVRALVGRLQRNADFGCMGLDGFRSPPHVQANHPGGGIARGLLLELGIVRWRPRLSVVLRCSQSRLLRACRPVAVSHLARILRFVQNTGPRPAHDRWRGLCVRARGFGARHKRIVRARFKQKNKVLACLWEVL